MSVVTIIPARGGSKGIPRKNLIDFCGQPLLNWSIDQARGSKLGSKVFVSTDNKEIAEVAKKRGAEIVWRPDHLSTDTASSEEALLHAIEEIEKSTKVDVVVFLQATSPLRTSRDIDDALVTFQEKKADSLFSAAICDDICLWNQEASGEYKSFTFDYKNRGRRQDRKPLFLENGSIYAFRPEVLRKNRNRIGGNIAIHPMPMWKSFEIDNIEDVEFLETLMSTKILKGNNL